MAGERYMSGMYSTPGLFGSVVHPMPKATGITATQVVNFLITRKLSC